jgi:hypothetical protein
MFGLLAVDELPGWSDIPALAKVSVIAALLGTLAAVIASLMILLIRERRENNLTQESQRKAFSAEVANARKHQEGVVERICESYERSMADVANRIQAMQLQCHDVWLRHAPRPEEDNA